MLSVSADVISRDFLNLPIIWVFDITEYILLYVTFLGTAWVLKNEGHVTIDLLLTRLKPRTQALFGIASSVIGMAISMVVAWYGAQVTWDHLLRGVRDTAMLELPKAPILAIIPIGSFLLVIQFLRRAYGYLGNWQRSSQEQRS
jgi:TRAP-type C4-dicarboxylate transport system permease small subunit